MDSRSPRAAIGYTSLGFWKKISWTEKLGRLGCGQTFIGCSGSVLGVAHVYGNETGPCAPRHGNSTHIRRPGGRVCRVLGLGSGRSDLVGRDGQLSGGGDKCDRPCQMCYQRRLSKATEAGF